MATPLEIDLLVDRADPYLIWAEVTGYAGFKLPAPPGQIPIMVEIGADLFNFIVEKNDPFDLKPEDLVNYVQQIRHLKTKTPLYDLAVEIIAAAQRSGASRILTMTIDKETMLPVIVSWTRAGIYVRFQLAVVRGNSSFSFDVDRSDDPEKIDRLRTFGVVDDGCPIAHASFRPGTGSRFLSVWDQEPADESQGAPWKRYRNPSYARSLPVRYGTELRQADINDALRGYDFGTAEEKRFYTEILHRPTWGSPGHTHGAGVLDVLAGPRSTPGLSTKSGDNPPYLVFVQLPNATVADTSGGSIGYYVVDGARYIVARTREKASDPKLWRTTINLSLGSMAGPHDGSTMTEQALDDLSMENEGQVDLVVAAGNTAELKIHAVRMVRAGASGTFFVMVPPANPLETYVEFWLPAAEGFEFVIDTPLGVQVSTPVTVGQIVVLDSEGNPVEAAVVFASKVAQGLNGTMVLLTIRATSRHPEDAGTVAPFGIWRVEVRSESAEDAIVNAWVERDDTIVGPRRKQQAHFVHDSCTTPRPTYISDESTLNSIGNGKRAIIAGAYDASTRQITRYSGRGPVIDDTKAKPDYFGPSERSASRPGIRVAGFYSGTRAVLSGTSVATPRVARWISERSAAAVVAPNDEIVKIGEWSAGKNKTVRDRNGVALNSDLSGLPEESQARPPRDGVAD
ncbi:MAG: hypothetical protein ABI277_02400 [Burkholderiaceae bacterium]